MHSATDLFCGAGGSSQGAAMAGVSVVQALNHWDLAVETHRTNFPDCRHETTDVHACNPRRYERTDFLLASPECTNHSLAKAVRRRRRQRGLFEDEPTDAGAERSRATMWDVVRFSEAHRYEIVIVENVPDVRQWECWEAWIHAMRSLGYAGKTLYLNSRFFGVPQSRDRLYAVFWRERNPAPALDFRPTATCPQCGSVEAVQSFKSGERLWGRFSSQYLYRCPHCSRIVSPSSAGAATAIDWQIPTPTIGERIKPLSEKTIERIAAGLSRYGQSRPPLIMTTRGDHPVRCVSEPLSTVTAGAAQHWLITAGSQVPCIVELRNHQTVRSVLDPLSTVTAGGNHHALLHPHAEVEACRLRMLQPHEIQAAMGFDEAYVVKGNKREKIRQLGNAVTPPVMRWIVSRCLESLNT
jgi:DNA (cytosine-5)-methyltransferase 1